MKWLWIRHRVSILLRQLVFSKILKGVDGGRSPLFSWRTNRELSGFPSWTWRWLDNLELTLPDLTWVWYSWRSLEWCRTKSFLRSSSVLAWLYPPKVPPKRASWHKYCRLPLDLIWDMPFFIEIGDKRKGNSFFVVFDDVEMSAGSLLIAEKIRNDISGGVAWIFFEFFRWRWCLKILHCLNQWRKSTIFEQKKWSRWKKTGFFQHFHSWCLWCHVVKNHRLFDRLP